MKFSAKNIFILIITIFLAYLSFLSFYNKKIESKEDEFLEVFSTLEKTQKDFIDKTNTALFYYTLGNVSPKLSLSIEANKKCKDILIENTKNKIFENQEKWSKNYLFFQAILDNFYLLKRCGVEGNRVPENFNWEENLEKFENEKYDDEVVDYISKRILQDLGIRNYDFDEINQVIINSGIGNDKYYYGYYLTHIIIYDSDFFKKTLDLEKYNYELKELTNLIDYVVNSKEYDLASEIYLCLSHFQLFRSDEYEKLENFLFSKETYNKIIFNNDCHLKIVYLLSLSMKYEISPIKEGYENVANGEIKYEIFGHNENKTPIVLINGGPGWSHEILLPLLHLSKKRHVVFYDQIGSGKSNRNIDFRNLEIENYVEDLHDLIKKLGYEKINLLGHSWGSMIAIDYALKYGSELEKVILSSPIVSAEDWMRDTNKKVEELKREITKDIDIENEYNKKFVLDNFEIYKQYFNDFNENMYFELWGKNEYSLSGISKNYERIDNLKEITVPIFFTVGEFDEISPNTVIEWSKNVNDSKYVIFMKSNHAHYLQRTGKFIEVVNQFLEE